MMIMMELLTVIEKKKLTKLMYLLTNKVIITIRSLIKFFKNQIVKVDTCKNYLTILIGVKQVMNHLMSLDVNVKIKRSIHLQNNN